MYFLARKIYFLFFKNILLHTTQNRPAPDLLSTHSDAAPSGARPIVYAPRHKSHPGASLCFMGVVWETWGGWDENGVGAGKWEGWWWIGRRLGGDGDNLRKVWGGCGVEQLGASSCTVCARATPGEVAPGKGIVAACLYIPHMPNPCNVASIARTVVHCHLGSWPTHIHGPTNRKATARLAIQRHPY